MHLAAVFALFAMAGMFGLATWHSATPHSAATTHMTSMSADHDVHVEHTDDDDTDLVHLAAHAVSHTVYIAAQPAFAALVLISDVRWIAALTRAAGSVRPDGLLRPPRG